MTHFRSAMISAVLASVFGIGACSNSPPMARTTMLTASLAGASENPSVTSAGTGTVQVHLNKQTNLLTWTIEYSGLSGPVTAGHFHGPAVAGQNAGVTMPMSGAVDSPIKGTATLTAAQSIDLLDGKWYVNLHTAANPDGEIRGQVVPKP